MNETFTEHSETDSSKSINRFHDGVDKSEPRESNFDMECDFSSDEEILNYFAVSGVELSNKDKWLTENSDNLQTHTETINNLVKKGLLIDSEPETVRQYFLNKNKNAETRIRLIRSELENNQSAIRDLVQERLKRFLPNFSITANVKFLINESADFQVDGNTIYVDLLRLSHDESYTKTVINGLSHEAFHQYFHEGSDTPKTVKDKILKSITDEGLAVLIGGQSLEEHYQIQGANYEEEKIKAFDYYSEMLKTSDNERLEIMNEKGFDNMGYFYIVGYEMTKRIYQSVGSQKFKEIIPNLKKNPSSLHDLYIKYK